MPSSKLRQKLLKETHDTRWAGHPGEERTLALLARSFHWPKMKEDMQAYVKTCHVCQVDKTERKKEVGLKADLRSRSLESFRKFTEYASSHASSPFFSMTLFCKQKEFNSESIFVPIFEYDFGSYVVNVIKFHVWLNAYL